MLNSKLIDTIKAFSLKERTRSISEGTAISSSVPSLTLRVLCFGNSRQIADALKRLIELNWAKVAQDTAQVAHADLDVIAFAHTGAGVGGVAFPEETAHGVVGGQIVEQASSVEQISNGTIQFSLLQLGAVSGKRSAI